MVDDQPPSWVHLLTLMVHGPALGMGMGTAAEPTVRGAIRSRPAPEDAVGFGWVGYARQAPPVFTGMRPGVDDHLNGPPLRVWRDGAKIRIEEPDGRPNLIVGDELCWRFDAEHDTPVVSATAGVRYAGSGTHLLGRREPREFADFDFTRPNGPVGETTFLGRRAWTVELAPPRRKPHPMQLVVDAETGLVLQQRNDGLGSVDEWVEFVVGEHLDEQLFAWAGEARTEDDEQAAQLAEHEADMARRQDWFIANVAALPIAVELTLPVHVHAYDDSGGFQASLGERHHGSLARRPHSDAAWELGWSDDATFWSDERWDWAVSLRDQLTPTGLEALKRQLRSR
jgi:hypothetical protein